MKLKSILAILASFFLFTNCEDSQNYSPLRKIDGNWRVTRLRYIDNELKTDSSVNLHNVTLFFADCSKEQNKQPSNCDVTLSAQELGSNDLVYNYQVTGNESLTINGGFPTEKLRPYENLFNGGYKIVQLDNSNLRLVSDRLCNVTTDQPQTCRYRVEIDAVK